MLKNFSLTYLVFLSFCFFLNYSYTKNYTHLIQSTLSNSSKVDESKYEYKTFDFYLSPNLVTDEVDTLTINFYPILAGTVGYDSLNRGIGIYAALFKVEAHKYIDTNKHYLGDYKIYANDYNFVYNTIEDMVGDKETGNNVDMINLFKRLNKPGLFGPPEIINGNKVVKFKKDVQFYFEPTNKQAVLVGYCYRILEVIEWYRQEEKYMNNPKKEELVNAWFPINPNFADIEYHYSIKARKRK